MIKTRAFDARANHLNAQAKHEVPKQRGVETRRTPKISISDDTPPVPKTSKDKRDYQNQRKVVKFPAQMSYDLSCTCYLSSGVVSIAALAQHKLRQLLHDQVIPARSHARAETQTITEVQHECSRCNVGCRRRRNEPPWGSTAAGSMPGRRRISHSMLKGACRQ